MKLPLAPPVEPMLAKSTDRIPDGDGWIFEPKWDGFRCIVFRDGDETYLQSRDLKPLDRYFPELAAPLLRALPPQAIVDGEIVIAGPDGLDFPALLQRIHPAASRVKRLAEETPASFVAFDLLALAETSLLEVPFASRRSELEKALAKSAQPIHLTPATRDRNLAEDWFQRFEGAGLDGIVAKRSDGLYTPGERTMMKIKHKRTADCVVAGFRWHKTGPGTKIGSLLLGLYDDEGRLHHVGITAAFTDVRRRELVKELEPLRERALDDHPWKAWREEPSDGQRRPGATSRWNQGKNLSWEPLRVERVCEIAYDHLEGDRFRHATHFQRWRPDKRPEDCRYDQLEVTPAYELAQIFGGRS